MAVLVRSKKQNLFFEDLSKKPVLMFLPDIAELFRISRKEANFQRFISGRLVTRLVLKFRLRPSNLSRCNLAKFRVETAPKLARHVPIISQKRAKR